MAPIAKMTANQLQSGDKLEDRRGDESISTPVLVFTDADSRHDLYKLSKTSNRIGNLSQKTAENSPVTKPIRKRPHVADLVLNYPAMSTPRSVDGFTHSSNVRDTNYATTGIGMALGSPSQSPWIYGDALRSSSSLDTRGPSPLSTSVPSPALALDDGLRDRAKWKMFGGLFAKKTTSNPATPGTPFYKAQLPTTALQAKEQSVTSPATLPRHRRVASRSLGNIHNSTAVTPISTAWTPVQIPQKPSLKKTQTAPVIDHVRSPTPPPKDYPAKQVTAAGAPAPTQLALNLGTLPSLAPAGKPNTMGNLLEVDIPNVAMERYSVMFSDVLKPRQSLLARRQAQLPQLKMMDPPVETKPTHPEQSLPLRRATIPSPTYSLFPLPPSSKGSTAPNPQIPKPLARSATAPPASPAGGASSRAFPQRHDSRVQRTTYSPSQSSDTPASLHDHWRLDLSPASTIASEKGDPEERDEQMHNILIISSESSLEAGSRESLEEVPVKESEVLHEILKPSPPLPKHHLPSRPNEHKIAGQTPNSVPRSSSLPHKELLSPPIRRKQSLSKQQPGHTTEGFREIMQPNPLKSSPANATEISVARKLSLSRKQQMLVPIIPKAVQQPQQPKLIIPDQVFEPPNSGRKRSESRPRERSQYIVLDSV